MAEYRIRKNSKGRYSVQSFIGYTDGRPSWGRTSLQTFMTRNGASEEITRLRLLSLCPVSVAAPPQEPTKIGESLGLSGNIVCVPKEDASFRVEPPVSRE